MENWLELGENLSLIRFKPARVHLSQVDGQTISHSIEVVNWLELAWVGADRHSVFRRRPRNVTSFATRAAFVTAQKMLLKIFGSVSCVRAARNNVAAFSHRRATSQDTMLPPQSFLVVLPILRKKGHFTATLNTA